MQNKKRLRKRLFVDPRVQGTLSSASGVLWVACMATITLMLLCWRIVTGPARMFYTHFEMWYHFGPASRFPSTLLLPLVIVDMIRLSNRFTGPMLRLRRGMRALSQGENPEAIEFREGDFWEEFAEEFRRGQLPEFKPCRLAVTPQSIRNGPFAERARSRHGGHRRGLTQLRTP